MNITLPEMLMVGFDAEAYRAALADAGEPGEIDPEDYIDYKPFEDCQITDLRQHVERLGQDFKEAFADLYSMLSMLRLLHAMSEQDDGANCKALCDQYAAGGKNVDALQAQIKPEIDAIRQAYLDLTAKMESSIQK